MKIANVLSRMSGAVVSVSPTTTVLSAVRAMNRHGIGSVLVMEEDRLVGIFTERDVLTRVVDHRIDPAAVRVGDVMTRSLLTVQPDMDLTQALRFMSERRFRHMPVVQGGELSGLVSIGDLTSAHLRSLEQEVEDLNSYIHGPVVVHA